ncbi:hypothetical protein C0995_003377 [Termitomyces sp. Mi166|nr:hypothetical protein C0995_003377 [Termitomyces sp. Mi166\
MFNKLGLLALATPLVNALTLNIPSNPTSGGPLTVTWTFQPGDTLELINEEFHDSFAIANNVQPELQSLDITLPIVPVRDGYTLEAVNVGNINQVFSTTGDFAVGPNAESTASSATQASTSVVSSASVPATASSAHTSAPVSGSTRPASSAFGSTVTAPSGSATATGSATGSNSGSASGTAQNNPATTSVINGASNYKFGGNKGAMAAALLSALAGAAIVVL